MSPTAEAPELVEVRYAFTESEQNTVNQAMRQIDEMNRQLEFFLNHVIRDRGLRVGQYNLTPEKTGLVAMVPKG